MVKKKCCVFQTHCIVITFNHDNVIIQTLMKDIIALFVQDMTYFNNTVFQGHSLKTGDLVKCIKESA